MTRVLVVDDHPMWRTAVAADLARAGIEVVGTAADGASALHVAAATRPDVVLLDLQMPVMGGVEAVERLRQGGAHVLVLSASGEHRDVLDAVRVGASGYLVKSATAAELVDAVLRTSRGEAVFSPGLAGLVLGEQRRPAGPRLTPRETEILRLVATGRSYRQIADELVISHRTVQNHVQSVLGKLQLRNRVQLARYALDSGLEIPANDGEVDERRG